MNCKTSVLLAIIATSAASAPVHAQVTMDKCPAALEFIRNTEPEIRRLEAELQERAKAMQGLSNEALMGDARRCEFYVPLSRLMSLARQEASLCLTDETVTDAERKIYEDRVKLREKDILEMKQVAASMACPYPSDDQ